MATLSRRIGLGLAARGEVDEVVDWAGARRDARASIRSGSTTATSSGTPSATSAPSRPSWARTRREDGFRVALGAVNPFTRHPVVLAMTGSALDEMPPGRIVMGLGTGLPLRLKQMGIPYAPDAAVERRQRRDGHGPGPVGRRAAAIRDTGACRRSSRCSRRRTASRSFIAAYRKEFVALAGPEGRRLPGPAGGVGPVPARDHRAAARGCAGRGPRPGRRSRPRATCCRSSTRRGARR